MEELPELASLFTFTSHDTALCLIPPRHLWPSIDRLRSLYDKAYGTWPPHVNLIYPFVRPEVLSQAANILSLLDIVAHAQTRVQLEAPDTFNNKRYNTILLRPAHGPSSKALSELRTNICAALSQSSQGRFQPHLTIAQSDDSLSASHKFLVEKVRLLAPLAWDLGQIAVLVRDAAPSTGQRSRRMRVWGYLDASSGHFVRHPDLKDPYNSLDGELEFLDGPSSSKSSRQPSYHFSQPAGSWQVFATSATPSNVPVIPETLVVASYNVLAEFEWPPQSDRHPGLVENLMSSRAAADILVLQEVTDHFLPFLLANDDIRSRYPFATHGPPGQHGIGPLPSLLNVVVLSKFPLQWEYLPFQRKHKGCTLVTFPTIGSCDAEGHILPLVLAGCHLTQGLVDGAVVAKKNEMQRMIDHLSSNFANHAWILAGDFNLATSSYTIDAARRKQDISSQTIQYLRDIDMMLFNTGFQDTWLATRLESGESSAFTNDQQSMLDAFEGEQGATFDPISNNLAADLVGSGLNNRPQRYDRILLKANNQFRPQGFNMFGQSPKQTPEAGKPRHASDHWGIRCLLVHSSPEDAAARASLPTTTVQLYNALPGLQKLDDLKDCLEKQGCFPSESDRNNRTIALQILGHTLLDSARPATDGEGRSGPPLVLVPVGSYGLGVWTSSSDIDCLCIGSISSRTFFTLALQRLRKAASDGISVLRRVRANSGYMLELEVNGIKVDLQYCAATSVAEKWPEVMKRPSSDPVFGLPIQTLAKLKPVRDLFYILRSIPDMTQYRMAHLLIKGWAKARGIYSSKFGFLGGIHISVLLVPICKLLAVDGKPVSTSDIITTFFHHYANFDWKFQLVFDPFFHKRVKYHRTFREPLCLLGWHAPSLNTAVNASIPTVKTIAAEFDRANKLLSAENQTWDTFFNPSMEDQLQTSITQGATEFLKTYRSYIKVDAHFWGSSPEKGSRFVGWLESRCIMLLVDLDRKLAGMMARIWPARFVDRTYAETRDTSTEYHGSYLVGLEWNDNQAAGLTKEQAKRAQEGLKVVLEDFESRIRGDEKYYDGKSCYMTTSIVRGNDLGDLELDDSRWGEDAADNEEDDSDDELDLEEQDDETEELGQYGEGRGSSGKSGSLTSHGSRSSTGPKPAGLGKFRTAADVLNRLRWDGNLNSSDYIVGYEDRFVGARERPVEQWKSEQTDEEFIPQHRILYFKRKSDGVILWERRSRIDDIFGSGVKTDNSRGAGAS
ncbi:Fc.00g086100.m01.CDS01 [Cosmosporella sp. VM-42]